jgi:hypothetical protein
MSAFKGFIKKFWSQEVTGSLLLNKQKYIFNSLLFWDVIPLTEHEDKFLKTVNCVVIAVRTLGLHKFYIQNS